MTTAAMFGCTAASVVLAVWGFLNAGMTLQAIIIIVFGIAWGIGQTRKVWIANIGFLVMTMASILEINNDFPAFSTYGSFVFALLAWDLAGFSSRLRMGSAEDNLKGIETKHFLRLGMVLAAGLVVIIMTRIVRLRFSFEIAALLVLAGAWGISLLVGSLRRSE